LLVLLLGGLAAVGFWLRPGTTDPPPSLQAAAEPSLAPVEATETDDARSVTVLLETSPGTPLTTAGTGRVTASSCQSGQMIAAGSAPFALDGAPVVALALRTPPWRDLAFGDSGDDVRSLQEGLAGLGQPVEASGWYDGATDAAWQALLAAGGGPTTAGRFVAGQVLWLPSASATVSQCQARLGDWVQPGATLAVADGGLVAARVQTLPDDLGPGQRELVLDGVTAPVDGDGVVAAAELAGLAEAETVQRRLAGQEEGGPAPASLRLVEPRLVHSLPPSALTTTGPTTGCVADETGRVHRVTIVGSKLGRTFVVFDDGDPPAQVALSPATDLECR
jgi:peptidoglycan hydrolase-like protein with peptidoglycan-binding domain